MSRIVGMVLLGLVVMAGWWLCAVKPWRPRVVGTTWSPNGQFVVHERIRPGRLGRIFTWWALNDRFEITCLRCRWSATDRRPAYLRDTAAHLHRTECSAEHGWPETPPTEAVS